MSRLRVVQWSTGGLGAIAVRAIAERPDLELVGVWVHGSDKQGRDAGELAAGVIEAGTVAAVRFETIGVVDGRDAIVIEHGNRMAPGVAPDWLTASRDGTYRIRLEGEPTLDCELTLGGPRDFAQQGMVATAMRVVDAIPCVVAARAGLVSSIALPPLIAPSPFSLPPLP